MICLSLRHVKLSIPATFREGRKDLKAGKQKLFLQCIQLQLKNSKKPPAFRSVQLKSCANVSDFALFLRLLNY